MHKKLLVALFILLLGINASAKSDTYMFKITANSNETKDIDEMYEIKNDILNTFTDVVKGFNQNDIDMVLIDNVNRFKSSGVSVIYQNSELVITIGNGKGKTITGQLKENYCEEVTVKKTKFFLLSWLGL